MLCRAERLPQRRAGPGTGEGGEAPWRGIPNARAPWRSRGPVPLRAPMPLRTSARATALASLGASTHGAPRPGRSRPRT
eukprot:9689290-Alexandrium_andersonii.AAC.1